MTVKQNILCGLCREKAKALKERSCRDILRLLQLEGLENHRPHQLSGGQQQRVALARILVGRPRLLLLDEPFSALDSHLRLHLQMEMQRLLSDFGHDALLVTHSRDEAYHLSQSIAVMEKGRISIQKETKSLFSNPENSVAARLIGCRNIYPAKRIDTHLVSVPKLGITLRCAAEVREGLTAVGIRAQAFSPDCSENVFPIYFHSKMEEPFERIIRFRYEQQTTHSEPVWWRFAKKDAPTEVPSQLGVSAEAILPLYDAK